MLLRRVAIVILLVAGCGGGSGGGTLSRADWNDACARLLACRPGIGSVLSVTSCAASDSATIAALPRAYRDAARCANKAAGDCAAILACFDLGQPTSGCDVTAKPYCLMGGEQWACFGGVAFVDDCAQEGLTCQTGLANGAACSAGMCGGASSDAGPTTASCRGEQIVECVDGLERPRTCGVGEHCTAAAGAAECEGTGAPCPPSQAPSCSGPTTLVTCVGGHEASVDCAAGGWKRKCQASTMGPPSAACVGDDVECDPATFADRCNGARLEYCQDGLVRGLDCWELGFRGCAPADPSLMLPSRCIAPIADAGPPPTIDGGAIDAAPSDARP